MTKLVKAAVEAAYAGEWGRSVAALARRTGDLGVAEDCVQDAFMSALHAWDRGGIPENTGAWIRTAAWRRFIDGLRAARTRREVSERLAVIEAVKGVGSSWSEDSAVDRDELALIFLCAHPALDATSQVMLMLRAVGGLTPREIAAGFFLERDAVRSRLLRAKRKVRDAGIELRDFSALELSGRLSQVLAAVYLVYNEAYVSAENESAHRTELATVALRLADRLAHLLPDERETRGLLALLLYAEARLPGRSPQPGVLVPLDSQDRAAWSKELVALGNQHLAAAGRLGTPGVYSLQAAISALHCDAASFEDTDWRAILALYDRLLSMRQDWVVALNRLVALAHVRGPSESLRQLMVLGEGSVFAEHYLFLATRAELSRLRGDRESADRFFREAAGRVKNPVVRQALMRRMKLNR